MTRMDNLDKLLLSDNINGSIVEIDNFIGELCTYGDDMEKLTEVQKLFYINQNLEREVNNGGFSQYFINSSGNYAHETIKSLQTIGANTTADLLQNAIDQFPDHKVPKNRDERMELVKSNEEKANEVWEELNQKFYQYTDNLNDLNINYIKKNRNEF